MLMLQRIAATLLDCPCGGRFTPGAGPKCWHCRQDTGLVTNPIGYLHSPNMVVLDGACAFSDRQPPYPVRIAD